MEYVFYQYIFCSSFSASSGFGFEPTKPEFAELPYFVFLLQPWTPPTKQTLPPNRRNNSLESNFVLFSNHFYTFISLALLNVTRKQNLSTKEKKIVQAVLTTQRNISHPTKTIYNEQYNISCLECSMFRKVVFLTFYNCKQCRLQTPTVTK